LNCISLAIPNQSELYKAIDKFNRITSSGVVLSDEKLEIKHRCEGSLKEFVIYMWDIMVPDPFRGGFHIDAICDHLEALYTLDIHDLIINLPPRMAKSTICMVAYPAWIFCKDPSFSFLCTSYAENVSNRDSEGCGNLMSHPRYKDLWGKKFYLVSKNKHLIRTNKGGERRATTIGGAITGFGSNLLCIDDPNNVTHSESVRIRETTNNVIANVLTTRFGLMENRRRLLTQQRVHPNDSSGFLLSNTLEKWTHLCLPMEYEPERKCSTVFLPKIGKIWKDPRKVAGELLWPAGINHQGVARLKAGFFNRQYNIQSQLQQNPILKEGGIFEESWFRIWKKNYDPNFLFIIQSWDTAYTAKVESSSNACTTWGIFEDDNFTKHVMLLDVFSKKMEYPELRKTAIDLHDMWDPDQIVVEAKSSGHGLKSELFQYNLPVVGFNPTPYGNKENRARYAASFVEAGFVWIRAVEPHFVHLEDTASKLIEATTYYPNPPPHTDIPDIIDSMSQAFMKLEKLGWLGHNPTLDEYANEESYDYIPDRKRNPYKRTESRSYE